MSEKIIHFNFSNGNDREDQPVPVPPESHPEWDQLPVYTDTRIMTRALTLAGDFIKTTRGIALDKGTETYDLRYKHIGEMTPQQAYVVLRDSEKKEWVEHPTYFQAVCDRMNPERIAEIIRQMEIKKTTGFKVVDGEEGK